MQNHPAGGEVLSPGAVFRTVGNGATEGLGDNGWTKSCSQDCWISIANGMCKAHVVHQDWS